MKNFKIVHFVFAVALTLLFFAIPEGGDFVPQAKAEQTDEGIYLKLSTGRAIDNLESSNKQMYGAALGYDWGMVRLESEYIFRGDVDVNDVNEMHTQQIMGNIYLDWENNVLPVSPFVMAGAGVGFVKSDIATDNMDFAWHTGAGFTLELAKGWGIETMYRYTEIGTKFEKKNGKQKKFNTQEVIVGIRYTF